MGVEPVIMSAGELESERAGQVTPEFCMFTCFNYFAIILQIVVDVLLILVFSDHINLIPNLYIAV